MVEPAGGMGDLGGEEIADLLPAASAMRLPSLRRLPSSPT